MSNTSLALKYQDQDLELLIDLMDAGYTKESIALVFSLQQPQRDFESLYNNALAITGISYYS